MVSGQQGVFRIAAVEASSHAAHQRNNLLPLCEGSIGRINDLAHALDAEDHGLLDIWRFNLRKAQNLLGMIHAEGVHLHQHPAGFYLGNQDFRQGDIFCGSDTRQYNCFHAVSPPSSVCRSTFMISPMYWVCISWLA